MGQSLVSGKRQRYYAGIIFTLPLLIIWGLLLILPIVQTVFHGFTKWDGIQSTWIGLNAYRRLASDSIFWQVVLNNGILLISVPFAVFVPLLIAFLLNEKVPGWRAFRTIIFLPATVSWVVIGMVSLQFFIGEGILNNLLKDVGLGMIHQNMLASANLAIIPVAITFIWSQVGPNTLILLTGMATISPEIYGAARIEGAGWWTMIWRITVPLLRRFLLFSLTITLIAAFTALFSLIYVMTSGGPNYGTTTLEFFIYQRAFNQGQFGFGSSLGVVLLMLMLIVSVIQFRIARYNED